MTNLTDTRTSDVEPTEFEVAVVALLNQVGRGETDIYEAGKAFIRLSCDNTEQIVAEERERIVVLAQVYAVLFAECGAKLDEMSRFIATMDTEYRFQGFLGFGGKVYKRNDGSFYVDCYSEDRTSERQAIIDVANRRLSAVAPIL